MLVLNVEGSNSVFPSHDISEVAGVTLSGRIRRGPVLGSRGIEVRAGRGAAVGVVAKLERVPHVVRRLRRRHQS